MRMERTHRTNLLLLRSLVLLRILQPVSRSRIVKPTNAFTASPLIR